MFVMLCHDVACNIILCLLCYDMYVMICYVVCYVMLRYAMSSYKTLYHNFRS